MTISNPNFRVSGYTALKDALTQLNAQRGTKDPQIIITEPFIESQKQGIRLDQNTTNEYNFEAIKFSQALDEIIAKEGQPVEGGGSFQFMYFRFISRYNHALGTQLDEVGVQCFEQGFHLQNDAQWGNTPKVTLRKSDLASEVSGSEFSNTIDLESAEDTEQGTNLLAIGDKFSGSYPTDYQKYVGARDVFNNCRSWVSGVSYKRGHLVQDGGIRFECLADHTSHSGNRPPSGFWIARIFQKPANWLTSTAYVVTTLVTHNKIAYKCLQNHTSSSANEPPNSTYWVRVNFVPTVDYSPLTKQKVQYWINAFGGAKHSQTNNAKVHMIDPNVIIKDDYHPRTWVDCVVNDPLNIPSTLLRSGNPFDGLRVLVIDPSTGSESGIGGFSGNDQNGIAYAGNVAQFIDPDYDGTGAWIVFKQTQTDSEIYDFNEGDSWTKFPCEPVFTLGIPDRYVDNVGACKFTIGGGSASRQIVWKKGAYRLSELIGVGKVGAWYLGGQFECCHSVAWDSGSARIDCGNKGLLPEDTGNNSAIFVESDPLDLTRHFPYYVGFNFAFPWPRTSNAIPYGSVSIGERIDLPIFDLLNMNYDHQHNRKWVGPDMEDYLPIQGFGWIENMSVYDSILGGALELDGDYSMGIWQSDRNDNIRVIEYTHGHNGVTIPQDAAIGKWKVYQGVPGTSAFVPAQEPEILDTFNAREVIRGGIFTKNSFDSQGRYIGLRSRFTLKNRLHLALDAWRMVKPLSATNNDEPFVLPDRNIEPMKIKAESIISYSQLKNLVLGLSAIYNYKIDEFTIKTSGRCNIKAGDPVYYKDSEANNETTDSLPNTVKVVADKIIYSISKPLSGPGGFTRTLVTKTRLYP